ncbi:MAG: efflux RND transporter periplasmic adaptor subunit, partial [Bacteroidetes bacterium]|nr:efflux RND transporter periplasmic adaptor subunit [Bacteroidota bacterium]
MSKKLFVYLAAVAIVVVGGYFLIYGKSGKAEATYDFATVTKGSIETTVSATGTLSPVTTIDVGTQVSGTIDSVYVDYNDTVKAGRVLAVLDTTLLNAAVMDADANVDRSEAQLVQAKADYERNKALLDRGLISDAEYLPFQVSLKSQEASLKSSQAALLRAKRNLQYAVIKSPINGIVISRNVEAGQTVASSLSTPTLFVIAENLSRMEILADIDESDIGQIEVGQPVRFTVATYADKEFTGSVKQVRLQPRTVSNVVTYTAVVEADNESGFLLPGMTATIDFVTQSHDDVLLIPSKALRFNPTEDQLAEFEKRMEKERAAKTESGPRATGDSTTGSQPQGQGQFVGAMMPGEGGGRRSGGAVWYLDSLGQLAMAPLRPGLSDGVNTEILRSRVLTEGMKIIL